MIKILKAIVAVDNNWAIGGNNELLTYLPKDLKRFKEITLGQTIVMGRKTLESLPGGNPLKNRKTIILTRDKNYKNDQVFIAHSVSKALFLSDIINNKNTFVCGGGEIYTQMFPLLTEILVTKIHFNFSNVDTYFLNLNLDKEWERTILEEKIEDNGFLTDYFVYRRI